VQSTNTARLTFDGAALDAPEVGILSFVHEERHDIALDAPYRPADTSAVTGRPHYGVGGFHQFTPADATLSIPAELTFFYQDDEVADIDESSLAIYEWNAVARDWNYVGGHVDTDLNTVTTTIARLGLFTLAPHFAAGQISLSISSRTLLQTDPPRTTLSVVTGSIALNAGGQVPDGTVFTVALADGSIAGPRVTADDIDHLTPGTQIETRNGRLEFSLDAPGETGTIDITVFSREGTALGIVTLAY
jgi:hypothetical protein